MRSGKVMSLCVWLTIWHIAYKTLSLLSPAPRGVGDESMKGFGPVPLLLKHNTPDIVLTLAG